MRHVLAGKIRERNMLEKQRTAQLKDLPAVGVPEAPIAGARLWAADRRKDCLFFSLYKYDRFLLLPAEL